MEQIGGSAPKPPEFFALGQWASPRQDVPQQAQLPAAALRQSPFGGARRSGCPPAEPYPADAGLRVATKRPPLQQNHRLTDEIQLCSVSLSNFAPAPTAANFELDTITH